MATMTATATCEVAEPNVHHQQDPVQLCMFTAPTSTAEAFTRTAHYAEDPEKYLQRTLGKETFDTRKSFLSLPETVDMDRYGTGQHRQHFEQHIAKLLGKQHGLFFITGVQAQLAVIKIYSERAEQNRVAWHMSSHLESAEERSFEKLYGLKRLLLGSDPEALPTAEEVKYVLSLPSEERPAAILVEIPNRVLGCKTYTFSELEEISAACRKASVAFHMDGARLWEIEPYYQATSGKSFADLASLFDSVYVSFYKGLGGAGGAILVSNDEIAINEAKSWQRRAGGNCFTLAYQVIDDERGFNENIGTFARKRDKMIEVVDSVTAATADFKAADGKPVVSFSPEKATCCQIHTVFQGYTAAELEAARDEVQAKTNVRVFERLRPKETVDDKMKADREQTQANGTSTETVDNKRNFMEWMIMSVTEKIGTQVFVDAYVNLCKELIAAGGEHPKKSS